MVQTTPYIEECFKWIKKTKEKYQVNIGMVRHDCEALFF